MKNYLFLFLFLTLSFFNVDAHNQQENDAHSFCISSDFTSHKLSCDRVQFTAAPTLNPGVIAVGYFWDFGDGSQSTSQNPIHTYSSDGNYRVRLTVFGFNNSDRSTCNDDLTKYVDIECMSSTCGVTVNYVGALSAAGSSNIDFLVISKLNSGCTISNSTFLIHFANGMASSYSGTIIQGMLGVRLPVSCRNKVKKVTVTVYATNSSGDECSDRYTEHFNSGVCGDSGSGLEFKKISPNPVKHTINIDLENRQLEKSTKTELVIYNINGNIEKMKVISNNEQAHTLNVSELKAGIYILKLINNGQVVDSQKIVVSK